jgi:site-specific recombinase XerC
MRSPPYVPKEIHDRSGVVGVSAGKGGKEREVPLNASVRKAITLYLKTREDYDSFEGSVANSGVKEAKHEALLLPIGVQAAITRCHT